MFSVSPSPPRALSLSRTARSASPRLYRYTSNVYAIGGVLMSSETQIAANRKNARKSTGPKTPEGKAVSRFNALVHGLTAQHVVLPGDTAEDRAEFDASLADLVLTIQPENMLEAFIIQRVLAAYWRLRRAHRFEIRFLDAAPPDPSPPPGEAAAADRPQPRYTDLLSGHEFDRLVRYESLVERELVHAMNHLDRLLRRRAAAATPPPRQDADFDPEVLNALLRFAGGNK